MTKQAHMNIRGQTIIFSLMLALLASILVTSITMLWQADVQTTSLFRDGIIAFYIAQAGIERGKAEILNLDDSSASNDYEDDINETFAGGYYNLTIRKKSNNEKWIVSRGHFRDSERRINLTIQRDGSAPPGYAWGWYKKSGNTWKEE